MEDIVQIEMKKYNSFVELGVELVTMEQFDHGVEVKLRKRRPGGNPENPEFDEETSKYKWIVGADGARGVVRKLLGLTFLGETKVERFVVGDIKVEGIALDVGCFHLFSLSLAIFTQCPYRDGICGVI